MAEIGVNPDRVEMYNLSAAMGPRFAELTKEFTERIVSFGPSEMKTGKDWKPAEEEEKKAS